MKHLEASAALPEEGALDSERADALPKKIETQFANAIPSTPASRKLLLPLSSLR